MKDAPTINKVPEYRNLNTSPSAPAPPVSVRIEVQPDGSRIIYGPSGEADWLVSPSGIVVAAPKEELPKFVEPAKPAPASSVPGWMPRNRRGRKEKVPTGSVTPNRMYDFDTE